VNVGIDNAIDISSIDLFPNPTSRSLNITGLESVNYTIEIINSKGVVWYRGEAESDLNVSAGESGVHLVRFLTTEGEVMGAQKMIIK
jgi:hypothetical protein